MDSIQTRPKQILSGPLQGVSYPLELVGLF